MPTNVLKPCSYKLKDVASRRPPRVMFDTTKNTMRKISAVSDMSKDELRATWMTWDDLQDTKKAYATIVRMMMKANGPVPETEDICTRGLGKHR